MTDFLLELRSEEIPARMQDGAREALARLFAAEIGKAGLVASETVTYATPRRLALIARGLPDAAEAVSAEVKGPRATAPAQAIEGFLRKTGLAREALVERDGVLFAVTETAGRPTADVLAEAIPAIVRAFPWPKSMRWGAASASPESLRWVRPLHGIVALFGEKVVPVEVAGMMSGAATLGHRFHHPGPITIGSAADYVEKLRLCHVMVDQDERRAAIRDGARAAAAQAGLALIEDEGLVAENAGLTEWPVPLLGQFDPAFLSVPPEVIQLTARVNQKYFVCRDDAGALANAFVCVANIDAADGGARIVEGNRKVLAARLADARFFYETDLKVPLDEQAKKLDRIVFHEKLGTVADKVERVAKLARWLVEEGIVGSTPLPSGASGRSGPRPDLNRPGDGPPDAGQGAPAPRGEGGAGTHPHPSAPAALPPSPDRRETLADLAERAARLAKADLVTGMVGEFPELQGVMGGYYAAAQGEDPQVAAAIRDHYKPVGQGDEVPTAPVTVAVNLADKLDTLTGFFAQDMVPTGSKDPFALRRAGLAVIGLIVANNLRFSIVDACLESQRASVAFGSGRDFEQFRREVKAIRAGEDVPELGLAYVVIFILLTKIEEFFADRLKVQQREAGVRHDLIDAVFALGGEDDLVRLLARVKALQAFIGTEDGVNLLAGYKRAANILRKEGFAPTVVTPAEAGVQSGDGANDEGSASLDSRLRGNDGMGLADGLEPAEAALVAALDAAEPEAAAAVAREDFEGAMAALARLRAPIDAFFEGVTVNDPDPARRARRLALLDRVRAAVHAVADFSRIEG